MAFAFQLQTLRIQNKRVTLRTNFDFPSQRFIELCHVILPASMQVESTTFIKTSFDES